MRYFGTLFDKNYMAKGLALHYSMEQHIPRFQLFVLCLDEFTYEHLTTLEMTSMKPIRLAEVEAEFPELVGAKGNRSTVEYYFTLSPAWPLFLLRKFPAIDMVTTMDADIYFFSSPEPVYESFNSYSILITPHRFPKRLSRLAQYGLYNVSFQIFRNDANGLACLAWWFDRCIEWCYDKPEDTRFADQKYLDEFQTRFEKVGILEHEGSGLAPWNISGCAIRKVSGRVLANDAPLVFYHFHYLKRITGNWFLHGLEMYYTSLSTTVKNYLYAEYIATVLHFSHAVIDQSGDLRMHSGSKCVLSLLRSRVVLWRYPFGGLLQVDIRWFFLLLHRIKNSLFN